MKDGKTILKIHKSNEYDMITDYSLCIPLEKLSRPELEEFKWTLNHFLVRTEKILKLKDNNNS